MYLNLLFLLYFFCIFSLSFTPPCVCPSTKGIGDSPLVFRTLIQQQFVSLLRTKYPLRLISPNQILCFVSVQHSRGPSPQLWGNWLNGDEQVDDLQASITHHARCGSMIVIWMMRQFCGCEVHNCHLRIVQSKVELYALHIHLYFWSISGLGAHRDIPYL